MSTRNWNRHILNRSRARLTVFVWLSHLTNKRSPQIEQRGRAASKRGNPQSSPRPQRLQKEGPQISQMYTDVNEAPGEFCHLCTSVPSVDDSCCSVSSVAPWF